MNCFNNCLFLKWVLIASTAILFTNLSAQKETNWWYFGSSVGLDFNKINNGLPEVLDNGNLNSYEANASISDKNGNLLFYTDGKFVIDSMHDTMPNGKNLTGNKTTTQCIIVPNPGNSNKYYIFYIDYFSQSSFSFSEVDMSLRNGLGDIIISSKNTVLSSPSDKIA